MPRWRRRAARFQESEVLESGTHIRSKPTPIECEAHATKKSRCGSVEQPIFQGGQSEAQRACSQPGQHNEQQGVENCAKQRGGIDKLTAKNPLQDSHMSFQRKFAF